METRRDFLKAAVSTVALPNAMIAALASTRTTAIGSVSEGDDEADFLQWYDVDRSIVNLENAYWNVIPRPVMEEYWRQVINRVNVPFVRGVTSPLALPAELLKVGAAVRVTPALYNSTSELDQLIAALHAEQRLLA